MDGEYLYMEEGPLGKAYNLRLLRKLAHYVVPYTKLMFTALLLTLLITAIDLALPYLSKIATQKSPILIVDAPKLDRKILPSKRSSRCPQDTTS